MNSSFQCIFYKGNRRCFAKNISDTFFSFEKCCPPWTEWSGCNFNTLLRIRHCPCPLENSYKYSLYTQTGHFCLHKRPCGNEPAAYCACCVFIYSLISMSILYGFVKYIIKYSSKLKNPSSISDNTIQLPFTTTSCNQTCPSYENGENGARNSPPPYSQI